MSNFEQERLKVLEMIEKGKLGGYEAVDLINALKKSSGKQDFSQEEAGSGTAERLKILEMLENGKINASEAEYLIKALKPSAKHNWHGRNHHNDFSEAEDELGRLSDTVENFAKSFGEKVVALGKDVEPTLKKATKKVVEKTASVFDDISKSLNETLDTWQEEESKKSCCPETEEKSCCSEAEEKSCCEEENKGDTDSLVYEDKDKE